MLFTSGVPVGGPAHNVLFFVAAPFLHHRNELLVIPFDFDQVLVGEVFPVFLQFASEFRPVTFELIRIEPMFFHMSSNYVVYSGRCTAGAKRDSEIKWRSYSRLFATATSDVSCLQQKSRVRDIFAQDLDEEKWRGFGICPLNKRS